MSTKPEITHRRYTIKTLINASGAQARAIRGNIMGDVFRGDDISSAVAAVKEDLDARVRERVAKRGPDGVPTAEEFREAFGHIALSDGQRAMLRAHIAAPEHILTATDLARAAGYKDYSAANLQYGKLAFELGQELDWKPAPDINGEVTWTFVIATDAEEGSLPSSGEPLMWKWRLRPEVVAAMEVGLL